MGCVTFVPVLECKQESNALPSDIQATQNLWAKGYQS